MTAPGGQERMAGLREAAASLLRQARPEEARALLAQAAALAPDDAELLLLRIRAGIGLQDMQAARGAFRTALETARSITELQHLFQIMPEVMEAGERTETWLHMRQHAAALEAAAPLEAAYFATRLHFALRDYDGFLARFAALPSNPGNGLYAQYAALAAMLQDPFPDFRRPKIFCIGLSKTGTTSITAALEALGLNAMHFINTVTCEVLRLEDAFFCDALTDTPVCMMFETLYHMFPNAKFIYTTRALDAWEASFVAHYRRFHRSSGFDGIKDLLSRRNAVTRGVERAAIYATLFGAYDNAIDAWHAYDARVRGFFVRNDARRLLEMDVSAGDGWEKLCGFLGRAVPDREFPWRNRTWDPAAPEPSTKEKTHAG